MTFKKNFAFKILCLIYLSSAVESQLLRCINQPCKNGAQCVDQPGTYYGYNCRCIGNWKGVNCDQDVIIGNPAYVNNNQYNNPNYPNNNNLPYNPSWNNNNNLNNPLWNQNNPSWNNQNNPNWNNNQNNPLWNNNNNQNNPLWPNNNNNNLYNRPNNPGWNNNQFNNPNYNSFDNRYPLNNIPGGNNNNPLALNDPCINNPCMNGGYCTRNGIGLGGFTCSCSSGFYGSRCENYASQRTMLLGIILGTVLPGCAFIIICAIIIYCCCCRRRLK